jgi:subtilisin family serine protease
MIVHQLEVLVIDKDDQVVKNVVVTAEALDGGKLSLAEYDPAREVYFFNELRMGFYNLSARHDGFLHQEKRVQVHPKPTQELYMLIPAETAYTFSNGLRVAYVSHPELLGVVLSRRPGVELPDLETLKKLLKDLELRSPDLDVLDAGDSNNLPVATEVPGVFVVHRHLESPFKETALKGLRETPFIEAAGPIFRRDEKSLTLFTNRLMVRFLPEVTRDEVKQLINTAELKLIEEMSFAPNLFLLEASASTGEEINDKAEQLITSGRIEYAEPAIFEIAEEDKIRPNDFLWDGCWDRKQARIDEAWEYLRVEVCADNTFGSANIIIAVVDNGVASTKEGVPLNDDFNGRVSNGESKTYKLFDFINMVPHNADPAPSIGNNDSAHGTSCAGVALANANDEIGVAGAAPNTRLLGLIYPKTDPEKYRMFLWAAGIPVKTGDPKFPDKLDKGANIFTTSIGFRKGYILPGTVRDLLDQLTNRGRDGKGAIAIFAAGNEGISNRIHRPWGFYEKSLCCAASTLTQAGEMRASYSNFGHVDWCMPSSTAVKSVAHRPPLSYGIWTSSIPGKGTVPSIPKVRTELVSCATSGAGKIFPVKTVKNFELDTRILVGKPGLPGSETTVITGTPNIRNNTFKVQGIDFDHKAGEPVFGGPCNHRDNFAGTSAATPLSAGVCALVLTANPDLTWVEAREILRETAGKIDFGNTDPRGQWLDRQGNPATSIDNAFFSQFYGHGRLDAFEAVKAAHEYRFTRDLIIRKGMGDTGRYTSTAFDDSPDIWVRTLSPVVDPSPNAKSYCIPGPHQEPSAGKPHWIYARVKNRGTEASLDAWMRFYVAVTDGKELRYPEDWEPKNGIGNRSATDWESGVYFIGEVAITGIQPGADFTVNIPWPEKLIPPPPAGEDTSVVSILVEVLPLDGPDNNLAQKYISIKR